MLSHRRAFLHLPIVRHAEAFLLMMVAALVAAAWPGCGRVNPRPPAATAPSSNPAKSAPSKRPPLEEQLLAEDPATLAADVRAHGNPVRGALVFCQPSLRCASCHMSAAGQTPWGPDLTALPRPLNDMALVSSLVRPSESIRPGYETLVITTREGRTHTGLIVDDAPGTVTLRDLSADGRPVVLKRDEIEARQTSPVSAMPSGLLNQLASRADFLDLAAYVLDIAHEGPQRMDELTPDATLRQPKMVVDEGRLDHAGILADQGPESLERGAVVYRRNCHHCHGDEHGEGVFMMHWRFATLQLRHGSDPYRMYRTVTYGAGPMPSHAHLTPQERYDAIHYIRETFLKPLNPAHYAPIDAGYLASLPPGDQRGPRQASEPPWTRMDYGPSLAATYFLPSLGPGQQREGAIRLPSESGSENIVCDSVPKGIAVRLDAGDGGIARGAHWIVYEHDSLSARAAWSGRSFIDWRGVNFNGYFGDGPLIDGRLLYALPAGPGWAHPESGETSDPRPRELAHGEPYGPLPATWGKFQGYYHHGRQVVLAYRVGSAAVLESPSLEPASAAAEAPYVLCRTLEVAPTSQKLSLLAAPAASAVCVVGDGATVRAAPDGAHWIDVAPSQNTTLLKVLVSDISQPELDRIAAGASPPESLEPLTHGGPRRWSEVLTTKSLQSESKRPFAVDVLTEPADNPWACRLRFTGLDFFADGQSLATCTFDGDVWKVSGLLADDGRLQWQRIASGLYQPLGLKIRDGEVFVCCRDQIVRLHDLNGDGETDFYDAFNSDHLLSEHFHEFASGLQTDPAGNFYYARGARLDEPAVPHDGTLLRVAADGSKTEILAAGLRTPNGVWLDDDGTCFVSEQDGHWVPNNALIRVQPGAYYGYARAYPPSGQAEPPAIAEPLCWAPIYLDQSPAEPVRAPLGAWGPLGGALLYTSFAQGRLMLAPVDKAHPHQGGLATLPLAPFPTGLARGRFHPQDGALYMSGLFVWGSTQTHPGGLYRIRYTGAPVHALMAFESRLGGLALTFSGELDPQANQIPEAFHLVSWSNRRTENYGSEKYDERRHLVTAARLRDDRRTVELDIPDLRAAPCVTVRYTVTAATGQKASGILQCTLHTLGGEKASPP